MAKDLPTLAGFRALRDEFQAQRRIAVLPQLKAQKQALERDLAVLYKKHAVASKHDKQLIESNMLPLQWDYQYVRAQLSVIEAWLPSVPDHLRAQVFEIKAA